MKKLIIAGTGIKFLSHLTLEVKSVIENSSCVVFLLNEPAIKQWITKNAKKYISLDEIYFSSTLRFETYSKIAAEVIQKLKTENDLCFLMYGHPTFYSTIVEELKYKLRSDNVDIQIMPGISALDCLFADLNIDPGVRGLQSYDATEFILQDKIYPASSHLVLWQISAIGNLGIVNDGQIDILLQKKAISILVTTLQKHYPKDQQIILYVASQYPGLKFEVSFHTLEELSSVDIPRLATLYIPPVEKRVINQNVLKKLNLPSTPNLIS